MTDSIFLDTILLVIGAVALLWIGWKAWKGYWPHEKPPRR